MDRTHINVEIKYKERGVDFRIPAVLEPFPLKMLIEESMHLLQFGITGDFLMKINGKAIHLTETKTIAEYGVGNGDQLELFLATEVESWQS